MEQLAIGYKNCYNLNSIIIRPETIWGYKEGDIRVIPCWIKSAIKGKDMIIYGSDKELSPLYVDDFILKVIELSTKYNKHKNQTWTITGQVHKAQLIADWINFKFSNKSKVIFRNEETTQPQKITKRKNEFRANNNFDNDLYRYMKEKKE